MRTVSKTSERTSGIHILGVPEGEKREKGAENIFEDIISCKLPQPKRGNRDKKGKLHRTAKAQRRGRGL